MQDHPTELAVSLSKESESNSDRNGPCNISSPMSCSKQCQIWGQTRCSGLCPAESCKPPRTETTGRIWATIAWLSSEWKIYSIFLSLCPSCLVLSPCTTREDLGLVFSGTTCRFEELISVPKATSSLGSKAPVPQLLLTGQVLQPPKHLGGPSLNWLQFISLVLGDPEPCHSV